MTARVSLMLVLVLGLTAILLVAGQIVLVAVLNAEVIGEVVDFVVLTLVTFALVTVGAVVAVRRRTNPIGWIMVGSGWVLALNSLLSIVARAANAGLADPILGSWAVLVEVVTFIPAFVALLVFLPLFFPDGKLLSPRWRLVVWLMVAGMLAWVLRVIVVPTGYENYPNLTFPISVTVPGWAVTVLDLLSGPVLFGPVLGAVLVSLIMRFRRSSGVTRQQYKWVALPAALLVIYVAVLNELDYSEATGVLGVVGVIIPFIFPIALIGLPVGVGVAVMRYRLYEIDRLISRTLSYSLVIGLLAVVFAAVAVGIPQLLDLPDDNTFLIAGATLAAAALFNPLRRHVQASVDRRFNRARFDAQQEVDHFSERLRAELEVDDIAGEMLEVVTKTMQPATASMWIRGDRR
jgi:hypothetical protein